ncbi:AfsR/SARP family transcriptional regulator, partial [Geodermatophilus sp. CPCC 205761]|uniref:AfsR/SARP family transcriptional regulator n=1 Tax=Geodermatophilus sp. CPCC 205761 TaxID=2936597 RepID=UPI003EEE1D1F
MRYGLLGAVEARRSPGDRPLDLGSPLQRVLLGLLLTEAGRPVSVDRIVEELWGEAAPADPEASVQTYVSRLRRLLGPDAVARTPAGYRLAATPGDVDAGRFAELAAAAGEALGRGDAAAGLAAPEADRSHVVLWAKEVG